MDTSTNWDERGARVMGHPTTAVETECTQRLGNLWPTGPDMSVEALDSAAARMYHDM